MDSCISLWYDSGQTLRIVPIHRSFAMLPHRSDDCDGGRPLKRIKLGDSELAKEADVVNLTKPCLGSSIRGFYRVKYIYTYVGRGLYRVME